MNKLELDLENFIRMNHLYEEIDRLRKALAEKDPAYNQLMEQAVRFATGCGVRSDSVGLEAVAFLASPAVQQWRKGHRS